MKSKITHYVAERFSRSLPHQTRPSLLIDAPAPELTSLRYSPYFAGVRASHLARRFADNDPLRLAGDDLKIFGSLCRLRDELRILGGGKIEAEVTLGTKLWQSARCDFLISQKVHRDDKDILELKLTGKPLPQTPESTALLQAAAYAELVERNGFGHIQRVIVCYMSIHDGKMRLFVFNEPRPLRKAAAKFLLN